MLSPRSQEASWSTERAKVVREDLLADISPVAGSQQLVVTGSVLASTNQLSTGQPRKRGHDSSSEDLATEAPLVRQKHIADILNATDMEDVDESIHGSLADRRIDRDDWPSIWQALGEAWPSTAVTPFPQAHGSTSSWIATAAHDTILLLQFVRRFDFTGDLMDSLDVQVLVHWTANWRQECLLDGLQSYRGRVQDHQILVWLDQWIGSITYRATLPHLPTLLDSGDDWSRLRELNHASDDILKLCDPRNKVRFSQHLVCALLFDAEITALTDSHSEGDSPSGLLRRHLQLVRKNPNYKSAVYPTNAQEANWCAVVRFFADALTPAGAQQLLLY